MAVKRHGRTLLTTMEAASTLGISRYAVISAIRRGALRADLVSPKLYLVDSRDVERYRQIHLGGQGWDKRRARRSQDLQDLGHGDAQ